MGEPYVVKELCRDHFECTDIMEITIGRVKAVWTNLGEGWSGDYDEDDPDDDNLLRFDVYFLDSNGEIVDDAIRDASYCTQMPAGTDSLILAAALVSIALEYWDVVNGSYDENGPHMSTKRIGEALSYYKPSDITKVLKEGDNIEKAFNFRYERIA